MEIPIRFLPTQEIAPETFLVRQIAAEGVAPVAVALNTLVIRGEEPVIVDTGVAITRPGWLEHTFAVVDPADVRWIYLSHDDADHTGNLFEVLHRAPKATIVTDWFSVERMGLEADEEIPLDRVRILNPGESFAAGDRTLTAHIPPVFDSPTTRGLFDDATGVYWAADAFATMLPHVIDSADEFDPEFFRSTFLDTQRLISPWHRWLDTAKYRAHLDMLQALDLDVAVGCHGVALRGAHIDTAFELLAQLPELPNLPLMGQVDLDGLLESLASAPAA